MTTSSTLIRWLLTIFLFSFVYHFSSAFLNCGQCIGGTSLLCPDNDQNQFTVKLVKYRVDGSYVINIKCSGTNQANFNLLEGCSFPTVSHVKFYSCPFPNESFIDIFDNIGVQAKNVRSLDVTFASHANFILEPYHLKGLSNLTDLYIYSTLLQDVSELAFQETPNLRFLYLVGNKLDTLPLHTFQPTLNLISLSLSQNSISSLPKGIFDNLRKLESLVLWSNAITSLPPGIFDHLESLQNLTFQSNKLQALDNIFTYTLSLQNINFKKNELVYLSPNLFENCSQLRSVHISSNALVNLPETLFQSHPALTEVSLEKNQLDSVPEGLFLGAPSLVSVKMSRNYFKSLPEGLFSVSKKLKFLDLSNNAIETLPLQLFASAISLEVLDISNNSLVKLEDNLLRECYSLSELRCRDNKLTSLSLLTFPSGSDSSLKIVDFSGNNLTEDGIISHFAFALNHQLNIEEIDLSYNRLSKFPSRAEFYIFVKLRHLNFEGNFISWVSISDILNLNHESEVNLKYNLIERVQGINLDTNTEVKIKLEGNNFICDCNLYTLIESIQETDLGRGTYQSGSISGNRAPNNSRHFRTGVQVMDSQKLVCKNPANLKGQKLSSLDLQFFTCSVPSVHCSSDCPCSFRPFDNMMIVNCSGQQRKSLPSIQYYDRHNYSLDLSHNLLSSLNFSKNESFIVTLDLKDNLLVSETLSHLTRLPSRLEFLHLGGNNLTHLEEQFVHQINSTGARVDLRGNPWVCDCNIKALHDFIQAHYTKVVNVRSVTCASDGKPLVDLTEEDVCPLYLQPMVIASIGVIAALLVLFAILGTVIFYRYNTRIKVWLFAHKTCLWLVTEDEIDVYKEYDAFISYSHKDEDFINNYLVPGLEKGEPQYRVCLHYRDWVVGEFIQNQILDSVHNSRRTLVVLSTNFIESVWGQMEFRAAHQQALQDKTNRVIVIVYGEMPPEEAMDNELLHYIKLHTYLKWDDPRFWDSLRYAMPHPKHLPKKRLRRHTKSAVDKLELVNGHVVVNKDNAIAV